MISTLALSLLLQASPPNPPPPCVLMWEPACVSYCKAFPDSGPHCRMFVDPPPPADVCVDDCPQDKPRKGRK